MRTPINVSGILKGMLSPWRFACLAVAGSWAPAQDLCRVGCKRPKYTRELQSC